MIDRTLSPSSPYVAQTTTKYSYDIICGRDRIAHFHPGNHRFRQLIHAYREVYQFASRRDEKSKITQTVIETVRREGGRFVKELDGQFLPVEDAPTIHEKVSHALRSAKDPQRTQIRKAKRVDEKKPTPEEEQAFEALLVAQQSVYRNLVERRSS